MKVKSSKDSKGITLVALVITIIVLIILAGISINLVLGENGIFKRAIEAREKTEQAQKDEQSKLVQLDAQIENLGKKPTVKEVIEKKAKDSNEDIIDAYGNKITIPAGFTIVQNGVNNVEYQYSQDQIPCVQDGIVVQDSDGNQFVWIPVGTIKNKDGSRTDISLGRYAFDSSGKKTNYSGDYTEETVEEHKQSGKQNAIAKEIETFKTSATENGGYYLGRYEATKGENNKAKSKAGTVWNNVTQLEAATAAQTMYGENNNFTSDLVNSYAWDTAIVFIQNYSSGNGTYSIQATKNKSLGNTGEREKETTDKVCNIYDMASNCWEWTTETCHREDSTHTAPCSNRGGAYNIQSRIKLSSL